MFKHSIVVLMVIALSGCSVNVAGLALSIKPGSSPKPSATGEDRPQPETEGRAIRYSEASTSSLIVKGITNSADPVKVATVGIDQNFRIMRFLPISAFDAAEVPEGVTPVFVTTSTGTDLYTRVTEQASASFVWFPPKPILFSSKTVSAHLGSGGGVLLPVPQTIGTYGYSSVNNNVSIFQFQFPIGAAGDFEVTLGSGYAYVDPVLPSGEMRISPRWISQEPVCTQPLELSIDFSLATPDGKPIYALTHSDFRYELKGAQFKYLSESSFSEVASGSYRLHVLGGKVPNQQGPATLTLELPGTQTTVTYVQSL